MNEGRPGGRSGAVIAACAVVTKDVPTYAIVAGNPAQKIGSIFDREQIIRHEMLLEKKEPMIYSAGIY
jgi:serine acetyltransferase